jgi:hypothetical protein
MSVDRDFVDLVLGDRTGFLALAFGHDPHWEVLADGKEKYRHRSWTEVQYEWPARRDEMFADVDRELATGPVDTYWCPALRVSSARNGFGGSKGTNALPPNCLWFDLDAPPVDQELLEQVQPLLVCSGREGHLHGYVPLAEPVPVARHRALNQALSARLGADHKWSDDALLRLPGTLNHKTDPPGSVVVL